MKALGISRWEMLTRFECIQPMYSLVKRQVEVEALPLALSEQIDVIPYSIVTGANSGIGYNAILERIPAGRWGKRLSVRRPAGHILCK